MEAEDFCLHYKRLGSQENLAHALRLIFFGGAVHSTGGAQLNWGQCGARGAPYSSEAGREGRKDTEEEAQHQVSSLCRPIKNPTSGGCSRKGSPTYNFGKIAALKGQSLPFSNTLTLKKPENKA